MRSFRYSFLSFVSKVPGGLELSESPPIHTVIPTPFRGANPRRVALEWGGPAAALTLKNPINSARDPGLSYFHFNHSRSIVARGRSASAPNSRNFAALSRYP